MKLNQTKNKTFRRDLIVEIYYIKNQKQNKQRQYLKKEKKQTKTKHFRTDLMVKFTIKNKKKENTPPIEVVKTQNEVAIDQLEVRMHHWKKTAKGSLCTTCTNCQVSWKRKPTRKGSGHWIFELLQQRG